MAFDMKFDNYSEIISYEEEKLFSLIQGNKNYPQLNSTWESFYQDPLIYPTQAKQISKELGRLKKDVSIFGEQDLSPAIDRLIIFFIKANEDESVIKCKSD